MTSSMAKSERYLIVKEPGGAVGAPLLIVEGITWPLIGVFK